MIEFNKLLFLLIFFYTLIFIMYSFGGFEFLFSINSSSRIVKLTDSSFRWKMSKSYLRANDKYPWIILFHTERCLQQGPCKEARETIQHHFAITHEQRSKYGNFHLGSMDYIKNRKTRNMLVIKSIPSIVYVDTEHDVYYKLSSDNYHPINTTSVTNFLQEVQKNEHDSGEGEVGKFEKIPLPPFPTLAHHFWSFLDAVEALKAMVRMAIGRGFYSVFLVIVVWFAFICTVGGVMRCYLCGEAAYHQMRYLWRSVVIGGGSNTRERAQ
mmetsp:Transcript_15891/g.33239  ORF Transcript_15891/g.33239 Transcript_15891/m.33239 type:complete len:268 (-) Transcript_15891:461-1264(-)